MLARRFVFALTLIAGLGLSAAAQATERLTWDDLAPSMDDFVDPFSHLTQEQRFDLYDIFEAEAYRNAGASLAIEGTEERARANLEQAGLDVDALMVQAREVDRQLKIREETLIEDLNGKEVQIPGYVLPLEFDGTKTTEFLLVPYVGACIHTPPPPTNQIVHVVVEEGFENEGLFTPVWVTGEITTNASEQNLHFVDGAANISVGYALDASEIEIYSE